MFKIQWNNQKNVSFVLNICWRRMSWQIFLCGDVFWGHWSVPAFMSLREHWCDCNIHGLALLELWWDGAQAVGHLISFERHDITLYIWDMDKMFFCWVACWLNEAMTSGFAEICHRPCLDVALNSVRNWSSSDSSRQESALKQKTAGFLKAWAKTRIWARNTAWPSSAAIEDKVIKTSWGTVEGPWWTSDGHLG